MPNQQADERTQLLKHSQSNSDGSEHTSNGRKNGKHSQHNDIDHSGDEDTEIVDFEEDDNENPRNWTLRRKYVQVLLVTTIGLILPMASSLFAPAISDIASEYGTNDQLVMGGQSGFVCMLGIGPLFFAPMSETFGRRVIYVGNLTLFTLLQIPTALAPNVKSFIVLRTLSGFFGSVGVANGGGTISDMFETHERATVLGFYLLGPLLGTPLCPLPRSSANDMTGPTLGPMLGGLILAHLHWRWIFGFMCILSAAITVTCYFLTHETCAPIVLEQKKKRLEKEHEDKTFQVKGQSDMGLLQKIGGVSQETCFVLLHT